MSTCRTNRNAAALAVNANAPADQGVALPPNMALQDDPAVPQVAAPQDNGGGAPEPDDEPNPAHIGAGGGEEGTEKRTDKIDLRNVKSETFSGAVPPGAYDSGVRDWWEQLADQVEDAQISAGQDGQRMPRRQCFLSFLRIQRAARFKLTVSLFRALHLRKRETLLLPSSVRI
ncbi:hypothetical protein GN244_ATG00164 [Phytophthora infestans]|uniref:Uncharacterized protein n=1 Tax=Phytophthora infestans TaxID=4787 RepID=A0A833WNX8_PHYIN|nr:hypothetical protein GN244_ATG00164 [Phytophthora infestans]